MSCVCDPNQKECTCKLATAKAMLAALDEFFVTAPKDETWALWNILTALRGPDHNDIDLKGCTTVHIRQAALPRLSKLTNNRDLNFDPRPVRASFYIRLPFTEPALRGNKAHFGVHIYLAVDALKMLGLWPAKP